MSAEEVEVELHSTNPDAVAATKNTFDMLPGGTKLIEREGRFYLVGGNLAFTKFAAVAQGYVRQVKS